MAGQLITLKINRREQKRMEQKLRSLLPKQVRKVARQATSASMTPVLKTARALVVERTGVLRKSLGKKVKTYSRSGTVVAVVGPRTGFKDPVTGEDPVNIAHLVEFGTAPHEITAPPGGLNINGEIVRGTVMHPGSRAQPFMRPALDRNKTNILSKFKAKMHQGVERETKRMARA